VDLATAQGTHSTTPTDVEFGWHLMIATAEDPDTWLCVEVERADVDRGRFLGRVCWHPHAYRDQHGIDLGELVEVPSFEYVQSAHPANRHPTSGIGGRTSG
jgi:hypothetical protein